GTCKSLKCDTLNYFITFISYRKDVYLVESNKLCPACSSAEDRFNELSLMPDSIPYVTYLVSIDDGIAKRFGIKSSPAMIYFRRKSPILYYGNFEDSKTILRWLKSHDEIATVRLEDYDFEDRTKSFSPPVGARSWFIMFYNPENKQVVAVLSLSSKTSRVQAAQ
ncbi:unnamed protein product, partial [Soboliphyme baturini]|uniref:Thioredoxin domain-containing protein n=1 Tax=Soboliphyme baturini TaxID=241478 RepID=A0A183I9X9_9BILA